MKVKGKRVLKNGAIAGYVYYPKEKKWKWRIVGRIQQKGGGKEEMIQAIKNSGRYDEWVNYGSLFGYINNSRPRYYGYDTLNGKKYFSEIRRSFDNAPDEKVFPVFGFINSKKQQMKSFDSKMPIFENREDITYFSNINLSKSMLISSLKKKYEKNIISIQEFKDLLVESSDESLLILIGENHEINTDINSIKQIEIIEAVNELTPDSVPIYSEMPKALKNELNADNNKNQTKLFNMMRMSFLRVMYYLKYLQTPTNKNYIIPSNVSMNNRTKGSCNPEYAEDIKRVCQDNKLVIGIMGVSHIKCIKDALNETTLDNGSKLKVITILSDDLNDILINAITCMDIKFNATNTSSGYETICEIVGDSYLLDIPNSKQKGQRKYQDIIRAVLQSNPSRLIHTTQSLSPSMNNRTQSLQPSFLDVRSLQNNFDDLFMPNPNTNLLVESTSAKHFEKRPKNIQRNLRKSKFKTRPKQQQKFKGR